MHYRRREYSMSSMFCTEMLKLKSDDQAAIFYRCRSLSALNWSDGSELEMEGLADLMLDDNTISTMPRPGTSLVRPTAHKICGGLDHNMWPSSDQGCPSSGFTKPCSASPPSGLACQANEHEAELGTAVVTARKEKNFLNIEGLDICRLVRRTALAKAICDYLIYHKYNVTRALDLCTEATRVASCKDWWWKCRLAHCYYSLGLYRDAEHQFMSSLKDQCMTLTFLALSKLYLRLDQPNTALNTLKAAIQGAPEEPRFYLGMARIHEMMYALDSSVALYKKVLMNDASNIEGLACLAANYFYAQQPELSLRYYRRLLQMGIAGLEIWNNIGLCCFYSSQFDMALSCFDQALRISDDSTDLWYNLGHVGIGLGDTDMAYQSFCIALSLDQRHTQAMCNLGVLEVHKLNIRQAQVYFVSAQEIASELYQPLFNGALLSLKFGNLQDSFAMVSAALKINKCHAESSRLLGLLTQQCRVVCR